MKIDHVGGTVIWEMGPAAAKEIGEFLIDVGEERKDRIADDGRALVVMAGQAIWLVI